MKKDKILLDSSALLATLQGEKGSDYVEEALTTMNSMITTANFEEVLSILTIRSGLSTQQALKILDSLPLTILAVSRMIAIQSSALHQTFPKHGLSLGDRLCLATGIVYNWPVLTADKIWAQLSTGANVRLIR